MEPLTIVLLVLLGLAVAALIFLLVKYFGKMDETTRAEVLGRLGEVVKILLESLKDGKISQDELKAILQAVIRVIAAIKGEYAAVVAAQYGADEVLEIEVKKTAE